MEKFEFMLHFRLRDGGANPEQFLDALFEQGCDDALVAVGRAGMIGFDFTRAADSAESALRAAIEDVQRAIPGAELVRAGPDLVGLTEVAEVFGCTRQNLQKIAGDVQRYAKAYFPDPVSVGHPSLWHMAEIASWLQSHTELRPKTPCLVSISRAAARENLRIQNERVERVSTLG